MLVSPLWRGPGNIHGFILDGKSYRQGWATAQTPNEPEERQSYYYRVRWVEPCRRIGEVARRSS